MKGMRGHRNLLVTVNGSRGALDEALRVADHENCWVTVLKVVAPYEGDIDLTGIRSMHIREVLTSEQGQETRRWNRLLGHEAAARVRVEQGGLPETINRVAAEEGCDLIILDVKKRRGPGFLRRMLDGNLIRKVTRGAPCSVMLVSA